MGRDKAHLPFGAGTLAAHVRDRVRPVVEAVWLVVREGQPVPCDGPVIRDSAEGGGPLVAVAAGMAGITARQVLVVSCDLPEVQPAVLDRLFTLAEAPGIEACVPERAGRLVPDCAVYDVSAARPVAAALVAAGERRLLALPAALRTRIVTAPDLADLDPALESLADCDTPEAYAAALQRAGLSPPRPDDR